MKLEEKLPLPAKRLAASHSHYIRAWRKHKKMTVEAVAERAGLTASLISQLERGRSNYTQNSLSSIAKALEVDTWLLLAVEPGKLAYIPQYVLDQIDPDHHAALEKLLQDTIETLMKWGIEYYGTQPKDRGVGA